MSMLGRPGDLPALGQITVQPGEFLANTHMVLALPITIDSSARDALQADGSTPRTPTTQLRRGLVMGKITQSGKYAQYNDSAQDGTEVAVGILRDSVSVLDVLGAASDALGSIVIFGMVVAHNCYGLDSPGKADLSHIIFV
jgi:hypothetical protein